MAHLIQPITIDGAAYCCKCYGVSAALGRGTEGVLTDNAFALNGGLQTAVGSLGDRHNLTGSCGPWTLLTGSIDSARTNVDIYELWWEEGNMDDTMVYTTGGTSYYANWMNAFPTAPGLFDPWNGPDGIVADRAFRAIGPVVHPSVDVFSGPTLQQDVVAGAAAPALNPAVLTIQNFQGPSGGDTTNHYWKKVGTVGSGEVYEPQGEISFGVSCGETVYFSVNSSSTGGSGDDYYDIAVEVFVDGVSESTFNLTPTGGYGPIVSDYVEVTGGPCGAIVTFHAKSLNSTAADTTTTATVTAEVTLIT